MAGETGKIYNRPISCISQGANYDYCSNPAAISSAITELQPFINKTASGDMYKTKLSTTEIDNLVEVIYKICPDAIRTLPYTTIERLFLQIAMLPTIKDEQEVAILKLMSAISREDKTECIANYKFFYALLEASYYNNSPPLLTHIFNELDDRCMSFAFLQSNSRTSFIEGLIRMYNEQPTALENKLNYFLPLATDGSIDNSLDKVIILGLTDSKMSVYPGGYSVESMQVIGQIDKNNSTTLNTRLVQIPVLKNSTVNSTGFTNTINTNNYDGAVYKYGYDYYRPLIPVLVDTKTAYQSNALIQEAINGAGVPLQKPYLVPLLFFDYAKKAEDLKNREDLIFSGLDLLTIFSGTKIATTALSARRYWALFEVVGAAADISVRANDVPVNSPYRKSVDIYNGLFGLIGIKNLAVAGGTKSINTIQDLVKAIKTAKNVEQDIIAGKNITQYIRNQAISFKFAYASAKAERAAVAVEQEAVNMARVVDNILEPAQLNFFTQLGAYKKLLKVLDGLSEELKVKFVEDFLEADAAVLKALDDEVDIVTSWSKLRDEFTAAHYVTTSNPPSCTSVQSQYPANDPIRTLIDDVLKADKPGANNEKVMAGVYHSSCGNKMAKNFQKGEISGGTYTTFAKNECHPLLRERLAYMDFIRNSVTDINGNIINPDLANKLLSIDNLGKLTTAGKAGSHAEVRALSDALYAVEKAENMAVGAFPKSRLDEFSTFVRTHDEKVLQRCPCCFHITQGVKMIGNN